jgi:DNA-directed RNA polymerase subunit RPC12/RpoP
MAEPILRHSARYLAFAVLGITTHWRCVACGRDEQESPHGGDLLAPEVRCERCAQVMHWTCYWDHIAATAEYDEMIEMARDGDGPVSLCLGCRS